MSDDAKQLEYDELDAKVSQFLGELEDLCAKYSFGIGACGCCDSPWITTGERDYVDLFVDGNSKATCTRSDKAVYDEKKTPISIGRVKFWKRGFVIDRNGKVVKQ